MVFSIDYYCKYFLTLNSTGLWIDDKMIPLSRLFTPKYAFF